MSRFLPQSTVEKFLLVSLSFFGLLALWWLPLGAGYDEETHFIRVWQMANLDFLPNKTDEAQIPFPAVYWNLSYRRQVIVRSVDADFWEKYGHLAIDSSDYIYGATTRSVYHPFLLLPQAIVVRYTGLAFKLPALPVFYLARLAGLLSYLFFVLISVRRVPYGKWVLAVLAMSPMALLQAVTIGTDAVSNGIAFFFIANTLAISQKEEIGRREWWEILLLCILLFFAKVNLVFLVLLPLTLISPKRFRWRYGYFFLLISILAFFFFEVVGWSVLAYPRLDTIPNGTNPLEQIKLIVSRPFFSLKVIGVDFVQNFGVRLKNWVALYGYDYWPVPKSTYVFFAISLLGSLFLNDTAKEKPNQRQRFILLLIFFVGYIGTIVLMYLSFTPVGERTVNGVQGRYFIVVMPLFFLALSGVFDLNPNMSRWIKRSVVIFGILSLASYTAGLWLSYHVPCGSQYYQRDICYQPNYKNFSPESNYSPPLTNQLTLTQEISPECDGMTTLRVWVFSPQEKSVASYNFSLQDSRGDILFDQMVQSNQLPTSGWYSFSFSPDWDSAETTYIFTIHPESDADAGQLRVAYSLRPEYALGKLYENQKAIEQDIIFQYGCLVFGENKKLK